MLLRLSLHVDIYNLCIEGCASLLWVIDLGECSLC